jgi:hypothetical protein
VDHALYFGTLLLASFLFAKVEIQIEGGDGWAAKLPTWRIENRLTEILYGGRPLTGYHLYVQLFVLVFCHLPFAFGLPFSARSEALVLAFMVFFWILEDFLWFVVNPRFGIKKFKASEIWWHRKAWLVIAPREYFTAGGLAVFLYLYGRSLVL